MSKRVADLLVETLQAAGVKNRYGIVGDTLNRIAIDRSERGAPRRMTRCESESGQPVAEDRRPISNHPAQTKRRCTTAIFCKAIIQYPARGF
jgi:hypothetical protein